MVSSTTREFRYERKFLVERLDARQVRALVAVHPALFYQPYPPRYVNNLYLDTVEMEYYLANVSGVGSRRKVRVRWYGDMFRPIDSPNLEFKIKEGLVGTKRIYPFAPFTLDKGFDQAYFHRTVEQAPLPDLVKQHLKQMQVVLCNRYYRWYFASMDNRFRVTVDTEMTYYQVKRRNNRFLHHQVDYNHVVLELKYGQELDPEAERIAGFFPFSMTKNSKYVTGIERVYI